ncbi:MAG: hypothetical protein WC746_01480 [archaeon]
MKVFEILVYAIVALALIMLFFSLIPILLPQETPLTQLKKSVELAQTQTMQGKTISEGYLNYPKEFNIDAQDLADKQKAIVSFECNNPSDCCIRKTDANEKIKCTKPIEWDYDFINVKETKRILSNTRCIRIEGMPVCKVYFGLVPAQASINKLDLIGENNNTTQIKATLKNLGAIQITYGTISMSLYKKSSNGWDLTDYNTIQKEVPLIMPRESTTIIFDVLPGNIGEYKAEFTFDALNGGNDQNSITFKKETNTSCVIDESTTDTVQNAINGIYEEIHYCTGCTYAHECVGAWSKKNPNQTYYSKTKDETYCTKGTFEGQCQ